MEVPRGVRRRGLARPNGVVLVLSLLLAAAVSTKPVVTPRPVPSKAMDACSAVTADDPERALGRQFGHGMRPQAGVGKLKHAPPMQTNDRRGSACQAYLPLIAASTLM